MKMNFSVPRKDRKPLGIVLSTIAAFGAAIVLISPEQAAVGSSPAPRQEPAVSTAPRSATAASAPGGNSAAVSTPAVAFPYGGTQFSSFIRTSYAQAPSGTPEFYGWMNKAYRRSKVRFKGQEKASNLAALLTGVRHKYEATSNPEARADMEKQTGAFAWKLLKKTVPKFSLDYGFEFFNAVNRGQRQCYLQSAIVSGMMQAAGMKAGIVMVARSDEGEESNNGHAVTLVKLSNGTDCLVDVSDHHTPFVKQQRLMASDAGTGKYRYVVPQYTANGAAITGYTMPENASSSLPIATVAPLPIRYMVSQFDFYRGERAPGGFASVSKTEAGLAQSERFLKKAVAEDPNNPLAEYVLGRVTLRRGERAEARRQLITAYRLYDSYGFVPDGAREALALVSASPRQVAVR